MITNYLVLPIMIPLITAIWFLLWRQPSPFRSGIYLLSVIGQFLLSIYLLLSTSTHRILVLPMGGWQAPYGITLTMALLGSIMVCLCTFLTFICILYDQAEGSFSHPLKFSLIQFLVAGINL